MRRPTRRERAAGRQSAPDRDQRQRATAAAAEAAGRFLGWPSRRCWPRTDGDERCAGGAGRPSRRRPRSINRDERRVDPCAGRCWRPRRSSVRSTVSPRRSRRRSTRSPRASRRSARHVAAARLRATRGAVQPVVDAIAARVEPILRAVAALIEPLLDAIAAAVGALRGVRPHLRRAREQPQAQAILHCVSSSASLAKKSGSSLLTTGLARRPLTAQNRRQSLCQRWTARSKVVARYRIARGDSRATSARPRSRRVGRGGGRRPSDDPSRRDSRRRCTSTARARSLRATTRPTSRSIRSINPYRGCEHGCIYCYARATHSYLDLSPGRDFETEIFYKPNAVELLRAELARPSYEVEPDRVRHEHRSVSARRAAARAHARPPRAAARAHSTRSRS